jgi:hypothetical protein
MDKAIPIFQQLQHLLPLDAFQNFVSRSQADKYVKRCTCRNQLAVLLYAQATGRDSLRDIETSLLIQDSRWYHSGITTVARSTIAIANKKRPWKIYESLFYELLEKCKSLSFGTARFSFHNALYALDATSIDLCLSLFPWAKFKETKGAIKLHTLFNLRSQIPECVRMTDGKTHEITDAKNMMISGYPEGSIFVCDRGYTDYELFSKINAAHHFFVIRRRNISKFLVLQKNSVRGNKGVLADEIVQFARRDSQKIYPETLRLVTYYDKEQDRIYQFLTNNKQLPSSVIADIYHHRWEIELFFKWIKQHLKIKTFLGTSKNAVMTQIWVAMIYYLLLSWIAFQTKFSGTLLELTRMLEVVIFERIPLINLLRLNMRTLGPSLARAAPAQFSLF